jgi:hypothetical protein
LLCHANASSTLHKSHFQPLNDMNMLHGNNNMSSATAAWPVSPHKDTTTGSITHQLKATYPLTTNQPRPKQPTNYLGFKLRQTTAQLGEQHLLDTASPHLNQG